MKIKLLAILAIAFAVSLVAEVTVTPPPETGVITRFNRTKTLTVQAPATVSPLEYTIEFARQLVVKKDGVIVEEEAADPINIKLAQIIGRTFTRDDGTTFTGAQLFGDIKKLGDVLWLDSHPQP